MNIDLRSLRHIAVLARELNYTRAAEQLGLTQPALSNSIRSFEHNHGVKLFDRSRSGVQLTAVGREVLQRATQILQESSDLDRLLRLTSQAEAGEVRYGMAPLSAKALLSATLPQLLNESPQLNSTVVIRKADALLALLAADEIEFFIGSEGQLPDATTLRAVHIGWFNFSLLVRPNHPLLSRPQPATGSYPVLIGDQVKGESQLRLDNIPWLCGPRHIIEDYSAAANITRQSDAIWVSSAQAAVEEICEGKLIELPLKTKTAPPHFRVMIYSLSRRTLSPAAVKLQGLFQSQILSLTERLQSHLNPAVD